jgi:hypothetical protein
MHKLLLALGLIACAAVAIAQTVSIPYTIQMDLGPSLGKRWVPSNGYVAGIRSQTTTSDTSSGADIGKLVVQNNGGAIAVAVPQAGTAGFEANKQFCVITIGAGTATYTPNTSTINGASNKAYAQNAGGCIVSDGTNYLAY